MNLFKRKKLSWCEDILCLQKFVATILVISFSLGLVHSDIDLDGIPDVTDPFPETIAQLPKIISPFEGETVYTQSREVEFTGIAEVGSQIKLFEDGIAQELSCQEANASEVQGTGLLLSSTIGGSSVDQVGLLTNLTVVAQAFYNTDLDTVSADWKTNALASWATETLDDAIDELCSYQAIGTPDDRCGETVFPDQVIVLLTTEKAYLFDAQLRTFWKSIPVSNATSVAAENGKIFIGTETGVLVWDFAGDNFSKTFTAELPTENVVSLDTVTIGTTQHLLVATTGGTAVINLETDAVLTSVNTGILVGAAFTSSNRILWATETEVQISDVAVDLLVDSWISTDITNTVRFPFDAPGTVTVVSSDLIGLRTGVARVFDDGNGNLLVQHVTSTSTTLPMGIASRGHWLSTDAVEAIDVSTAEKDLDNVLAVTSVPAATGADTDIFEFGGTDRYLKSKTNTDFSITGNNLTVGAWVRRPDYGGAGPFAKIITHGEDSNDEGWDYWLSAGENFFDYGLDADPYFFGVKTTEGARGASAFTFALNEWQFLTGTYDGEEGALRMYLDGVEQDQNLLLAGVNPISLSGEIATVDKELRLGWGYDDEYFNGDIALPFIAEETYSPEQISLLHRYSNGWFAEDTTTTLRGISDVVVDVSCDDAHKECFVLTEDGTVTRIDGNLFSGGVTSEVTDVTNVAAITPTYLGTWQCTHAFNTTGAYTVLARTYWEDDLAARESELRNFVITIGAVPLDTPMIVDFQENFTAHDAATVLWYTNETEEDYFVAQLATDVDFQEGVRQQISRGHAARFDALEDTQTYYFRVKAQNNAGGVSEWSEVIHTTVDKQVPIEGAIENVDGRISSDTAVAFEWETTPFLDLGSGVLWYDLEVGTDQTFVDENLLVYKNDRLRDANYTFTGEQGQTYFARVRAMDAVGNWSLWAESMGTLVDTTAPENFTLHPLATTAGSDVRVRWTSSSDSETGIESYEIWQKDDDGAFVLLNTVGPEIRSYRVASLQDDHAYIFKIIATNGATLTTETGEQSVLIEDTQLVIPQWLSSSYSMDTMVSLEWTGDTDFAEATQYQIFRNEVLLGTVDMGTTTLMDPEVHASGQVFTYKVRAFLPEVVAEEGVEAVAEVLGEFSPELKILVDDTDPSLDTYEIVGPEAVNTWRNKNFSLQLWGTDGTPIFDSETSAGVGFSAGIDEVFFREGTTDPFELHGVPILITESGIHDFQFQFRDRAGNEITPPSTISDVKLDKIKPTVAIVQASVSDTVFSEKNGFISTSTLLYQIAAEDEHSGVDTYEISYRLDKNGDGFFRIENGDSLWSDWTTATGTLDVPDNDGILELRAAVTDLAGNRTISDIFTVKIDRRAPFLFTDTFTDPVISDTVVQLNVADMQVVISGTATVYYTKDGSDPKTSLFPVRHEGTTVLIEPGIDTSVEGFFMIKYYAIDEVGNESETYIATNNDTDSDGDGIPDWWEDLYGGNVEATSDDDGDFLTALQEFTLHTDPVRADTDGGNVPDGTEILSGTLLGTDPLNGTDHAFLWVSPLSNAIVESSFTVLGTATPGAVADVLDVTDTENKIILGTAMVDPQGIFSMEVSGLTDGDYSLQVTFLHPNNPLALIESEIQNITVNNSSATQPQISNIADNDQVGTETSRILVSSVSPSSTVELFEQINGITYSLGTVATTLAGTADIWLPYRFDVIRNIFVLDHSTWETSEVITFEQGVLIQGTIFGEDGQTLENATVELVDALDATTTTQSAADGTYSIFAHTNHAYTLFSARADEFITHSQILTTAFENIILDVTLLEENRIIEITGVVSGISLAGVTVRIVSGSTDISIVTAVDGTYAVSVPADETYTATYSHVTYDTHTQPIEVARDDVEVNVTLLRQEDAVGISGRVISAETGNPISGVSIIFTSNESEQFQTQSDVSGNFVLAIHRDRGYTTSFSHRFYRTEVLSFSIATEAVVLLDTEMTPNGLGSTSSLTGWSGRELDNPLDAVSDGWIPIMTYEESLAQVRRLNAGIAGQVKTREVNGREVFAGYLSGRIAVDNFRRGDDSKIIGISTFSDRVKELHASAKIEHCLAFHDTTMDFRDVSTKSRWYSAVAKMYSLGQMPLDGAFRFQPIEMLSWDTALELAFSVRCIQPDEFELLRSFNQDQWENFSLQNTEASRRAYTALDMGWTSISDDLMKSPTREQVLRLWMKAFDVQINPEAVKTSFEDVLECEGLAPILVAARKYNLIPFSKLFRPKSYLLRAEAAQWFVSFFEAERDELIEHTAPVDQFDDHKVATANEVTAEEQARVALLQKEISEERNQRIAETVPLPADLDIAGKSGFIRRQGESREDFLVRLALAKESVQTKELANYEELREQSLEARGIRRVAVEPETDIFTDKSGFIRRQEESREDFLVRLAIAKEELAAKKLALMPATMKASAPKETGPMISENTGILNTETPCNIKMNWETSEMFQERCGVLSEKEKETLYEKIFKLFRKTPVTQDTLEPSEVTIKQSLPLDDEPILKRSRFDVIFRRFSPEEDMEEQTVKTKVPTSDSSL